MRTERGVPSGSSIPKVVTREGSDTDAGTASPAMHPTNALKRKGA